MIKKTLTGLGPLLAVLFILGFNALAEAGYRGPFEGKVVDAETQEPLSNTVIHVRWSKRHFSSGPTFYDTAEVRTDAEGKFFIPRKWAWNPWTLFSLDSMVTIFKAGYSHMLFHWSEARDPWKIYKRLSKAGGDTKEFCQQHVDRTTRRAFQCDREEELLKLKSTMRFEPRGPVFELKKILRRTDRDYGLEVDYGSKVPSHKKHELLKELNADETLFKAH